MNFGILGNWFWAKRSEGRIVPASEKGMVRVLVVGGEQFGLMTTDTGEAMPIGNSEFNLYRIPNPFNDNNEAEKEDWLVVLFTKAGAQISSWREWEAKGYVQIVQK